jgi:hypothetical protein
MRRMIRSCGGPAWSRPCGGPGSSAETGTPAPTRATSPAPSRRWSSALGPLQDPRDLGCVPRLPPPGGVTAPIQLRGDPAQGQPPGSHLGHHRGQVGGANCRPLEDVQNLDMSPILPPAGHRAFVQPVGMARKAMPTALISRTLRAIKPFLLGPDLP